MRNARTRAVLLLAGLVVLFISIGPATAQSDKPFEVLAQRAAVAADHHLASQAGLEMLREGGNAVDAAVATSFCLSVVRPFSCGLGGGGFMVIYKPGTDGEPASTLVVNYREVAPGSIGPDYYVKLDVAEASRYGPHAVGVPGTVAGLLWALENFGTLDRRIVLAPAIRAAERGFAIDQHHVDAASEVAKTLERLPHLRDPAGYVFDVHCFHGNAEVGMLLRQPAQARALTLIADSGAEAFYHGPIAKAIASTMEAAGGPMTARDLAEYKPRIAVPLEGQFLGHRVLSMPPPSSGGVAILQSLGLIERAWKQSMPIGLPDGADAVEPGHAQSPAYVHLVAEAMKHAFADRAEFLADTKFVEVPTARLLSDAYLDELAARIGPAALDDCFNYGSVTAAAPVPVNDAGTSHISVIDKNGMAVACTETINLEFGSLVAIAEFGIVLNNEMDDFTTIPGEPNAFGLVQSDRNLPAAGKNPLSSMSPTIVVDEHGQAVLIAGASGGPRIISATLECILLSLVFGMPAGDAVAQPRFHHQWMPDKLEFEHGWPNASLLADLKARGHDVELTDKGAAVQLIRVMRDGLIRAASDPRKSGRPAGY
jgi:gamma-glutamyltranspeptidase/glutathione hydrolase